MGLIYSVSKLYDNAWILSWKKEEAIHYTLYSTLSSSFYVLKIQLKSSKKYTLHSSHAMLHNEKNICKKIEIKGNKSKNILYISYLSKNNL